MPFTPNGLWVPDRQSVQAALKPEPEIKWPPRYEPPAHTSTSAFFRCECGKLHMKFSGRVCPCGIEFPRDVSDIPCRSAA